MPGGGCLHWARSCGCWRRDGLGGAGARASGVAGIPLCAMDFRREGIVQAGGVARQPCLKLAPKAR
eukprot:14621182-Alexandrium_andersonii.AAC.1